MILLAVLIFAAAALILKTIKNASTQVLSWSEAVEAVSSEPVKNVQPSLSVPTQITKKIVSFKWDKFLRFMSQSIT